MKIPENHSHNFNTCFSVHISKTPNPNDNVSREIKPEKGKNNKRISKLST